MRKLVLWGPAVVVLALVAAVFVVGSRLTAPVQQTIGDSPPWLAAKNIMINSASGSTLRGWYYSPPVPSATVVLLHPVRGNRQSMLGRARFLSKAGLAVLLIDFQAHGESSGEKITFGFLESKDAAAAVDYAKVRRPNLPVVVLGSSLGGAAALLAQPPLEVEGLVLEAVFPSIEKAIENRLRLRLGGVGARFSSVLASRIEPALGIELSELSPVVKAREIRVPVFVVSGENDLRTTEADTVLLYESFKGVKSLWLVPNATHQDLHAYATEEYEKRILQFLSSVVSKRL